MIFGNLRSKLTPDRAAPAAAVDAAVPVTAQRLTVEQTIELLPIPAAVVIVDNGRISFASMNSAFEAVNQGRSAERSPIALLLGARICAFLESVESRDSFEWELGESVDCRYYRVHLARASGPGTYRCLLTLVDHTSVLRTEKNLRREMMTDSLTGLPNRAGFSELLEEVIGDDTAQQARYAVLIINLLNSAGPEILKPLVEQNLPGPLPFYDASGDGFASAIDAVLVRNDFPELAADLVAALACLNRNDLAHG